MLEFPAANSAPAFSMLFRQEPRFCDDFVIRGTSVVFFAWALDISSNVIELTADSESLWMVQRKNGIAWDILTT